MAKVGEPTGSVTPRTLQMAVVKVVLPEPIGAKKAMSVLFPIFSRNSPAALSRSSIPLMMISCFMRQRYVKSLPWPNYPAQSRIFCLSRNLYPAASEICSILILSAPSRSAIVRASLMIREQALADSPIFSIILSISFLHPSSRGQYLSINLLFIEALQNIPSAANLFFCISLAFSTLAAMTELGSAGFLSTSFLASIGCIHSCMSIQLSD